MKFVVRYVSADKVFSEVHEGVQKCNIINGCLILDFDASAVLGKAGARSEVGYALTSLVSYESFHE
jgi:hypothetical protein